MGEIGWRPWRDKNIQYNQGPGRKPLWKDGLSSYGLVSYVWRGRSEMYSEMKSLILGLTD